MPAHHFLPPSKVQQASVAASAIAVTAVYFRPPVIFLPHLIFQLHTTVADPAWANAVTVVYFRPAVIYLTFFIFQLHTTVVAPARASAGIVCRHILIALASQHAYLTMVDALVALESVSLVHLCASGFRLLCLYLWL